VAAPFRRSDRKIEVLYRTALVLNRLPLTARVHNAGATGRYIAKLEGAEVRFAIDGRDPGVVEEDETLAWSDVFFKANWWPSLEYHRKVRPLINGNGFLGSRRIAQLRALRHRPKDIDVCFVSNVWGGREHNVRLFEQLARLDARTELLAVLPPWGFDQAETDALRLRLRAAHVPTSERQISLDNLTDLLARSKIVFFRAGKHMCLPWRTLDLLALGSCIVFDSTPVPQWYAPLIRGTNYIDCGIDRPLDTSEAPAADYERVAPTLEALLADADRMEAIRVSNAHYFDEFVAPERIGAHLLRELRAVTPAPRRT
jgi:hypothetical protein